MTMKTHKWSDLKNKDPARLERVAARVRAELSEMRIEENSNWITATHCTVDVMLCRRCQTHCVALNGCHVSGCECLGPWDTLHSQIIKADAIRIGLGS